MLKHEQHVRRGLLPLENALDDSLERAVGAENACHGGADESPRARLRAAGLAELARVRAVGLAELACLLAARLAPPAQTPRAPSPATPPRSRGCVLQCLLR